MKKTPLSFNSPCLLTNSVDAHRCVEERSGEAFAAPSIQKFDGFISQKSALSFAARHELTQRSRNTHNGHAVTHDQKETPPPQRNRNLALKSRKDFKHSREAAAEMQAWGAASSPARTASGRLVENKEAKEARWLSAYRNALRLHAAVPKESLTADSAEYQAAWGAYAALLDDDELPSDARIRFFCLKNQATLEESLEAVDIDRVVQLQLQAAQVDETDRSLWLQIARNAFRLSRPKLARAALEQVVQLVPDHIAGLTMLRDTLESLGDYDTAALLSRRLRQLGATSLPQLRKPPMKQQSTEIWFDSADTDYELHGKLVGPSWHLLGQLLLKLHSEIVSADTHTFSSPVLLTLQENSTEQGVIMAPPLVRRPYVQAAIAASSRDRTQHSSNSNSNSSTGTSTSDAPSAGGRKDKGKGKAKAKARAATAPAAPVVAARASRRIQERSYEEDQNAAENELVARLAKQLTEGLVDRADSTAIACVNTGGSDDATPNDDSSAANDANASVTQSQEHTQEANSGSSPTNKAQSASPTAQAQRLLQQQQLQGET